MPALLHTTMFKFSTRETPSLEDFQLLATEGEAGQYGSWVLTNGFQASANGGLQGHRSGSVDVGNVSLLPAAQTTTPLLLPACPPARPPASPASSCSPCPSPSSKSSHISLPRSTMPPYRCTN